MSWGRSTVLQKEKKTTYFSAPDFILQLSSPPRSSGAQQTNTGQDPCPSPVMKYRALAQEENRGCYTGSVTVGQVGQAHCRSSSESRGNKEDAEKCGSWGKAVSQVSNSNAF